MNVCVRVCVWTASSENSVLNRRYLKEKLLYNKNWIFWGKNALSCMNHQEYNTPGII